MAFRSLIGAAALSCAFAFSTNASAQERNACMDVPIDKGVAVLEEAGGGTSITFLKGDERARAVELYNNLPPEDDFDWPVVMIADLPGGGGFVAVGRDSVFCGRILVPPQHWESVKRRILGSAA